MGSATVMLISGFLFMVLGSADSIDHRLFPVSTSGADRDSEAPREPKRPPPVVRMRVSGRPALQHGRAALSASGYVRLGGSEGGRFKPSIRHQGYTLRSI